MGKLLSAAQIARYHAEGLVPAVDVLSPAEVARYRADLQAFEAAQGKPLDFPEKSKSYLLFDWADAIVHHKAVLDAVEDLIGPDILVYHSTMWIKEAQSDAFVLWHQDGAHFHLDPAHHVTAWVALSDATEQAGCMRMIPGSHTGPWLEHFDAPSKNNMIRRGQGLDGIPEDAGIAVPVLAGQMSLHNTKTIHASGPNRAADRRMGYGISYIPTSVRPTGPAVPSALLVRGEDRFGHFQPETRLRTALDAEARAAHELACARFTALQNKGFRAA